MASHEISLCNQRLITNLIEQFARDEPNTPWISIPVSSDLADEFKNISYITLTNAINRAARWIEVRCGKSICLGTLTYIGLNDARYFIFFAAAVKMGYKVGIVHVKFWIREEFIEKNVVKFFLFPQKIVSAHTWGF